VRPCPRRRSRALVHVVDPPAGVSGNCASIVSSNIAMPTPKSRTARS
jgi:hypothetical protein